MKRLFALAVLALAASALAVGPLTWSHSTEADFTAGKLDRLSVNNQGEVTLARAMEPLVAPQEKIGMVSALTISPRGTIYVATSPACKVYRIDKGAFVPFAELGGALVRTLIYDNDGLVAGVSGKEAGLYRIDGSGKVSLLWKDEKVTFVWAVVPSKAGSYYVATGPNGNIYQVDAQGKATPIYHSQDKNILSLIAGANGLLYAGTGESGLVLEITPDAKAGRVLFDANEKEISSLAMDEEGTLFVATSDSLKSSDTLRGSASGSSKLNKLLKSIVAPAEEGGDEGNGDDEIEGEESSSSSKPALTNDAPDAPSADAAANDDETEDEPETTSQLPTHSNSLSRITGLHMGGMANDTGGNAVYRVEKDGCVRTIFRKNVSILAMALHEKTLTLATGHNGQVYTVDPNGLQSSLLATVDPKDVTALRTDGQGKLFLGTANQGGVFVLTGQYEGKGSLISKVLDAGQISRWGTLSVRCELPPLCQATVATRSGNVAKPDDATWSAWSNETPVASTWTAIASPGGRYLQYRLTLSGNGQVSPTLEQVQLSYQVHNLAPVIQAMQVVPSAQGQGMSMGSALKTRGHSALLNEAQTSIEPLRYRSVSLRAHDQNNDELEYAFYFRRSGNEKWIKLADKQAESLYAWDTLGVQDGSYEVKAEVSDAKANPPGASLTAEKVVRGIVVDNTAPVVTDLICKPDGKGVAALSGSVSDATSRISQIAYAVDNNDQWIMILPTSGICSCQQESFAVKVDLPDAGRHRIAVRTLDEFNNAGYSSVEVTAP